MQKLSLFSLLVLAALSTSLSHAAAEPTELEKIIHRLNNKPVFHEIPANAVVQNLNSNVIFVEVDTDQWSQFFYNRIEENGHSFAQFIPINGQNQRTLFSLHKTVNGEPFFLPLN